MQDSVMIGLTFCGVLLVLLAVGVHVGVAMMLSGFVGFTILGGYQGALGILQLTPLHTTGQFLFTVLPLFILMGGFALHGGIGSEVFTAARTWVGRLPGGMAIATIAGCAAFAAASGSSLATAATFTRISFPEMMKMKYDVKLAAGAIAAGGTLAILIPPSGMMVVYSMLTGASLGKVLIAGFIPGFMLAFLFMLAIFLWTRVTPSIAPVTSAGSTIMEKLSAVRWLGSVAILMVVILGGIYLGVFTPTEAGAIGALVAMIIALFRRKLAWGSMLESVMDTAQTTAMIFVIIMGAMIFGRFLAISGVTSMLTDTLVGWQAPLHVVLWVIVLTYIVLGLFVDAVAMLALTLPVFYPAVTALGADPVWFGILVIIVAEMALITPPVGMNVYVVAATIGEGAKLEEVFKGAMVFFVTALVMAALLIYFPVIALILPNAMSHG